MLWKDLGLRLRALLFRRRMDEELQEELQFHIQMQARKNRRVEMDPTEAMRLAQLQFGSCVCATEECREQRGISSIEIFAKDVRFAFRMLRRSPGFTAVALLTLALGIGANTAIFSVVYGVLLNPLPYSHPEQLVGLHQSKANFKNGAISFPNFLDWRTDNRSFSSVAILRRYAFSLTGLGEAEQVNGVFVSSEFFDLLGIRPALGR